MKKYSRTISVTVTPKTDDTLDALAKAEKRSLANYVRGILEKHVENKKEPHEQK